MEWRVYPAKMFFAMVRFAARFALRTIAYLLLASGLAALPMAFAPREFWPALEGLREAFGTGWALMGAVAGVGGFAGSLFLRRRSSLMRQRRQSELSPCTICGVALPTLSEWGIIAMSLAMSGSVIYLRRDGLNGRKRRS